MCVIYVCYIKTFMFSYLHIRVVIVGGEGGIGGGGGVRVLRENLLK